MNYNTTLIQLDVPPFVPEGWRFCSHQMTATFTSVEEMNLFSYISESQRHGGKISGNDLFREVVILTPANANLLDFFLEYPDQIPDEIKKLCPISFFGTTYFDKSDRKCVRILCENNGVFYWRWRWLDDFWRENNPVLYHKNFGSFNFLG